MYFKKSEQLAVAVDFIPTKKKRKKIVPPESLASLPYPKKSVKEKSSTAYALFFYRGRDAIYYLCKTVGIGVGDYVIAPAFICRSAIEPIIAVGAHVQFVEIATDWDYDPTMLEAAFEQYRPRALLAVHHFGKSPKLDQHRKLCDRFESILIEDRCHRLPLVPDYSSDLVGDYAIYSVRKFLPVLDGGILVSRENKLPLPETYSALSVGDYCKFFVRHIGKKLFYSRLCNLYVFRQKAFNRLETEAQAVSAVKVADQWSRDFRFPQHTTSSLLAKWLAIKNISAVVEAHHQNYRRLALLLPPDIVYQKVGESFETLFIPVAFPIINASPELDLVARLRESGIGAYAWPGSDLPLAVRDKYPLTEKMARQLVMLPIHYGLKEDDLFYIASVVRRELKQTAAR